MILMIIITCRTISRRPRLTAATIELFYKNAITLMCSEMWQAIIGNSGAVVGFVFRFALTQFGSSASIMRALQQQQRPWSGSERCLDHQIVKEIF